MLEVLPEYSCLVQQPLNLINKGRIKIPTPLIDYASLSKECVIIGVNDRLEIWSKENWNKFVSDSKEDLSDLADHLFETNFEM